MGTLLRSLRHHSADRRLLARRHTGMDYEVGGRSARALGGNVMLPDVHFLKKKPSLREAAASRPFDLESGIRVMCDVGYLSANFLVFLGL